MQKRQAICRANSIRARHIFCKGLHSPSGRLGDFRGGSLGKAFTTLPQRQEISSERFLLREPTTDRLRRTRTRRCRGFEHVADDAGQDTSRRRARPVSSPCATTPHLTFKVARSQSLPRVVQLRPKIPAFDWEQRRAALRLLLILLLIHGDQDIDPALYRTSSASPPHQLRLLPSRCTPPPIPSSCSSLTRGRRCCTVPQVSRYRSKAPQGRLTA